MKVVWIDDDGNSLGSQKRALVRAGFEVESFREVDRAWARIQQKDDAPLNVILDIMMGTGTLLIDTPTAGGLKTGEQFLRLLQRSGCLKEIKIFVYTITTNASTNAICDELGIGFYRKAEYPGKMIVDLAIKEFGKP